MAVRGHIRFRLGDDDRRLDEFDANLTLLRYLREHEGLTGTKEGCAEGDCGACTVAVGEWVDGRLRYQAVNACILFLPMIDGKHVVTVEHLQSSDGGLHPAQSALVDNHGSQCGFCTPGFVMSLFTLFRQGERRDLQTIDDALAGNLCRCTGYGPIIQAARDMFDQQEDEVWHSRLRDAQAQLKTWAEEDGLTQRNDFFAPRRLEDLEDIAGRHPDAVFVAGATDVGLWVTKQHRRLTPMIDVTRVPDLRTIEENGAELVIGAAVTYSDAVARIANHFPDFGELIRRIGSTQVRNSGTIGGNIANGSPIGDSPPALIALGTRITLNKGGTRREIPLEDYFVDYGQQDREKGEFLEKISIPLTGHGVIRCHKVSKRFDQDITAVLGAFNIKVDDGKVVDARIAYGGMAAIPKRATACERALIGKSWSEDTVASAANALGDDFAPISDMRASADYRLTVARNLLRKVFFEMTDGTTLRLAYRGAA